MKDSNAVACKQSLEAFKRTTLVCGLKRQTKCQTGFRYQFVWRITDPMTGSLTISNRCHKIQCLSSLLNAISVGTSWGSYHAFGSWLDPKIQARLSMKPLCRWGFKALPSAFLLGDMGNTYIPLSLVFDGCNIKVPAAPLEPETAVKVTIMRKEQSIFSGGYPDGAVFDKNSPLVIVPAYQKIQMFFTHLSFNHLVKSLIS